MNCNNCIRVNPFPSCIDTDEELLLAGLTFPNNTGDDILIKFRDTATGQVKYLIYTEGEDLDITSFFPLMQHYYKMEFSFNGVPVDVVLTNPDDTTATGCCIEFIPDEGLMWTGGEFEVNNLNCPVE